LVNIGSRFPGVRIALFLLLTIALSSLRAQGFRIGTPAGNFRVTDFSGATRPLSAYAGKLVALVFWSFKCPVALAYNSRLGALQSKYQGRGVELVAVDPDQNESPEEVKLNIANLNLPFTVWIDREGALAEGLGITHIPAVVVLDKGSVVRYAGALDNNKAIGDRGRIAYVEDALDSLIAGKPVATPETTSFGCTVIRRKGP
jgi:thiol-disulfide isomerase/thioredoxin